MKRDELQMALATVAKSAGTSPAGKSAFAELIVDTIQPNRLTLDVFSAFLPTRQLNVGDTLVKRVRNLGWPVRTMVPGTNHLADQIGPPRETYTYAIDYLIAKLRYSLWEIQRAELYTVDQMRQEMEAAIIDELVARIFTLIGSTWNSSSTFNNYVTVSSAVTEPVLVTMMENILLYAGNIRAIVGTRKALLPIYSFAGLYEYSPVMLRDGSKDSNPNVIPIQSILEEWRRTGRVTSFRGTPLIELPQIFKRTADAYDTPLLRDDQILVIGDNAGEAILYGGTEFQDFTDMSTEPPEYSLAMWRGYGMLIDAPEFVGTIQIT